jgi:hypothetical protein
MFIVGCVLLFLLLIFYKCLCKYIQPLACWIGSLAYCAPLVYIAEKVTVSEIFGVIVRFIMFWLV